MRCFLTSQVARRMLAAIACLTLAAHASAAAFFAPDSGKGPAVILISGASGTRLYYWYAKDVAKLGYTSILVDGRDISVRERNSAENLRKLILESQNDPRVTPGKVAVIGFSLGGGGALLFAAPLADTVASVVAYYPDTSRLSNIAEVAARLAVPTLVFAGEKDKYFNCCLIESIREFDAAARAAKAPFELITYPNADHGFNLEGSRYRQDDTADAWDKTKAFFAKTFPVK